MKNIFSFNMYGETMRRLRMIGLILLSICVLVTAVTIFTSYINWQEMKKYEPAQFATYTPYDSMSSMFPALVVFMYLGGFLLTATAFGFLNRRADSDFYHAIPQKRITQFITIISAVLSWVLLTIVACVVVAMLGCIVTGMIFPYNYLLSVIPVYIVGTFLMCAVTALAMSVTGTGFSNFIVAMLILLLPRFIMGIITAVTMSYSNMLTIDSLSFIFDASYNIPVGLLIMPMFGSALGSMTVEQMYMNGYVALYSLVLGVIYMALAALGYCARKSEAAGRSAPNRAMQHVYRCALTLPFVIFALLFATLGSWDFVPMIVMFILSLVVYFLFELITTKSGKKMLTSAPYYLVVAAVSVALMFGINAWADAAQQVTLEKDEVASISLDGVSSYYYGEVSYSELLTAKIEYTDEEMIDLATKNLKSTVAQIQSNALMDVYYPNYTIRFNLKNGQSLVRRLTMSSEDMMRMDELCLNTPEFMDAISALPKDDEISTAWIDASMRITEISVEDTDELWDVYVSEYEKLKESERIELIYSITESPARIVVRGRMDGKQHRTYYPISADLTPESMNMIIEAVNRDKDISEVRDTLNHMAELYEEIRAAENANVNIKQTFFDVLFMLHGDRAQALSDGNLDYFEAQLYCDIGSILSSVSDIDFMDMYEILMRGELATDAKNAIGITLSVNEEFYEEMEDGVEIMVGWEGTNISAYITLDEADMAELMSLIERGVDEDIFDYVSFKTEMGESIHIEG